MKYVAPIVVCAIAAAATSACGGHSPSARTDGRIGPFRIDLTTEAQIRAVAGKPDKVENQFAPPRTRPIGHLLEYRCGRGCYTAYSINNATGKLSDYQSTSRRFVTERGSRVGMSGRAAADREGKRLVPGCGDGTYLHLRWDFRHRFVLTVWKGRVESMVYLGPHSVYYDGLC